MGTSVGVGCSTERNPQQAGRQAAEKALEQLPDRRPDFMFVFATVGYDQQTMIRTIREVAGNCPLSGCSGEGVITQGMVAETNFAVCLMAIASDEIRFDNFAVEEIPERPDYAGERLAEMIGPFLGNDSKGCFVFADGLVFDFDPFNLAFEKALGQGKRLPIFGGLAADNWSSRKTYQYHNDRVITHGLSAILVSGTALIASGISHGCVPIGTKHVITRSKGNIIYEIDGVRALDALKDYVEEELQEKWNKISLNLCLGFRTPEHLRRQYGDYVVRYMMEKNDEEGYVKIQSDVQDGTEFWLFRRDKELIREGLQEISRQITEDGGKRRPKFVMHFECMGRGKVVFREQEKAELIGSLQEMIGENVPWIGFYTYGEIGPVSGYNCIHNFTAVVTAVF